MNILGESGFKVVEGFCRVRDILPPSVIYLWTQGIKLNILIPHLTTSDPNLTPSGQLPTGVANTNM